MLSSSLIFLAISLTFFPELVQTYNALSRVKREVAHVADKPKAARSTYTVGCTVYPSLAGTRSKGELGNAFSVAFQERYSWQFIFKQERLGNAKGTLKERQWNAK